MLTVIDGGGKSTQHERSIQVNGAGLIDISTIKTTLVTEQFQFEMTLKDLNFNGKKRLYKGLQKEISTCLKKSSTLLKKKSARLNKGDERGAEIVCMQYQKIRLKERLLWKQIKRLYEFINAS